MSEDQEAQAKNLQSQSVEDSAPSSIVIDTKHAPDEEYPLPTKDPKAIHPQALPSLQSEFTQQVFEAVSSGEVDELVDTLSQLGVKNASDIAKLIDEQNYSQNALFIATKIKDVSKAEQMVSWLV